MYKTRNATKLIKVLEAYIGDYNRGLHVREIAKSVKLSPSAVSYMTRNLEKQRIMNCKTEGRNKKYFINFDNPAAKDMIVAAELARKTETIEKYFITKKLLNEVKFHNSMVVLFGSFAKGTANEASDIDILIVGKKNEALEKELDKFGTLYKKEVQAIFLQEKEFDKKNEFVKEITNSHITLSGTEQFVNMLWRIANER